MQSRIDTYSRLTNENEKLMRKLYESNFDKDTILDFQKSCTFSNEILQQTIETKNMLYGETKKGSDN